MGNHITQKRELQTSLDYSRSQILDSAKYLFNGHKFLLVDDHLPNTGIGKYISNLFQKLNEAELDVGLFVAQKDFYPSPNGYKVIIEPPLKPFNNTGPVFELLSYGYFPRKVPKGYSLYHISSQTIAKYAKHIEPSVITCHDLIAFNVRGNHPRVSQFLLRKQFDYIRKARGIIFDSEHTKNDFLDLFDYPEERTVVSYLGVDTDIYSPGDKEEERDRLDLPSDKPIILNVGAEDQRKNMKTLMESISILRQNMPDVLLLRIGKKRPETAKIIDQLGLDDNVQYHDNNLSEEKLVSYYRAADLFAFPSYYEGFGMPILEAFATGCPLVASNATSIPEIAGENALYSDPFDVEGFAKNMEKCLEDGDLRQKLIDGGLERASQFTWENTASQTLELYKDVLEEVGS